MPVSGRDLLRWKRCCEADPRLNPCLQPTTDKTFRHDIHESPHRTTREIHLGHMRLEQCVFPLVTTDSHHEPIIDDADCHVPIAHKCNPSKHRAFRNRHVSCEQGPHTFVKFSVNCQLIHRRDDPSACNPCARSVNAGQFHEVSLENCDMYEPMSK